MDVRLRVELQAFASLRPHLYGDYHKVPLPQGWSREGVASWVFEPTNLRASIELIDGGATARISDGEETLWSNSSNVLEDTTPLVSSLVRQMFEHSARSDLPSNRRFDKGKGAIQFQSNRGG